MCSPRIFHNHLNTNVSSSFISTVVRDIVLKSLFICLGGVTLGMGETFADFHMSGMCPDLIELFHMSHRNMQGSVICFHVHCDVVSDVNNGVMTTPQQTMGMMMSQSYLWHHIDVIENCSYFRVSFRRHPLQCMRQSIFFLKATLSVASFSNFENMDFVVSDF